MIIYSIYILYIYLYCSRPTLEYLKASQGICTGGLHPPHERVNGWLPSSCKLVSWSWILPARPLADIVNSSEALRNRARIQPNMS